jgi:hypothetical protein
MSGRGPAAALLAAALLASGCGGADVEQSNAYVEKVNLAQSRFGAGFERLAREITRTSTPEQDGSTLQAIEKTLDATVADLRRIEPPERVADQHEQLVAAIAGYGQSVEAAAAALGGSAQRAAEAQARLAGETERASTQVSSAVGAINRKLRE